MSTEYKYPQDVPTEMLCNRLDALADVVARDRSAIDREFTMRIPAECDRDADIVLSEAARRLRETLKSIRPADQEGRSDG